MFGVRIQGHLQKEDGSALIKESKITFSEVEDVIGQKLSEEQKAAALSMKATVVSAGAGSGKTTVLSYRFMNLLLNGVSADRILTLTFTKKATGEMYERIYHFLSVLSQKDTYFKNQLENHFPKAVISTLDSFWAEIARAGSFEYGFPHDFAILDGNDIKEIVTKVFDKLENEDLDNKERESLNELHSIKSRSSLIEILTDVASAVTVLYNQSAESQNKAFSDLYRLLEEYQSPDLIRNRLKTEFFDAVIDLYSKHPGKDSQEENYREQILTNLNAMENKSSHLADINLRKTPFKARSEEAGVYSDLVKETYRPLIIKLAVSCEREVAIKDHILERYNAILPRFIQEVNKEKRRLRGLTYKDVEAIAYDTLLNNKNVRNFYKNRFSYIMIDEFQDNNSKQRDILYLLSEKKSIFTSGIPRAEDLDPNKLFFVGDSKQSIYRFRGADVSVFNELENEVVNKMGGQSLPLNTNYRSSKTLVEHFNQVFEKILTEKKEIPDDIRLTDNFIGEETASYSARHQLIRAAEDKDYLTSLEFYNYQFKNSRGKERKAEDFEAEFIARKIKEITDPVSGYDIPYFCDTKNENGEKVKQIRYRKAKYEDIAVLYPSSGRQRLLERALRDNSIAHNTVESNSALSDGLAYDIYSFLQLIVYPEDKKAFLTLLNSPLVRLSDEGQKEFLGNSDFKAFEANPTFSLEEDRRSYSAFQNLYFECRKKLANGSIASVLEDFYFSLGYHTYIVSSERTSGYDEHFYYIWALANDFDQSGRNVVEFLDLIRGKVGESEKLSDVKVFPLGSEGVTLMTVHKAKGLGFPIVILMNTAGKRSNDSKDVIVTKHDGKDLVFLDFSVSSEKEKKRLFAETFFASEEDRVLEEVKRTFYVAMTRAKNHFIMTSFYSTNEKNNFRDIYTSAIKSLNADEIKIHIDEREIDMDEFEEANEMPDSKILLQRPKTFYNNPVMEPGLFKRESQGVKESNELDFYSDTKGDLLPPFGKADYINEGKSSYSYFGTLVHEAIEKVLGNEDLTLSSSNGELDKNSEKALVSEAEKVADKFLETDFFNKVIKNNVYKSEERFYIKEDDMVLEGSADLLVFKKEYNLVVDYKTDRRKNPDIHKGQLVTYVNALEALYRKKCYGVLLYVRDFSLGPIWDKDGNVTESEELF